MPISHKHHTIFVHVPKAAGTSINKMLECDSEKHLVSFDWVRNMKQVPALPGMSYEEMMEILYCHPQHLKAHQLKLLFPNEWKTYYKFAIIRNPYERAVSEYEYIQKHRVNKALDFRNVDFETFMSMVYKLPPHTRKLIFDYHFDNQKDFVTINNKIAVDEIYRYENIATCMRMLEIMTDNPQVHELKFKEKPYQEYYTPLAKYYVEQLFQDDLRYFSYRFE